MRILIVEDEPEMALLVSRRLDRAGFSCDKTGSIGEAIEALRLSPYSLVLLDRRLPDGDGADHVSTLRSIRPDVSVMMVTALDAYRERVAGLGPRHLDQQCARAARRQRRAPAPLRQRRA